MVKNEVSLQVDVILFKDGEHYIAYSPSLEFSAYGDSKEDAVSSFDVSINLMLEEVIKAGTLDNMLLKYGWQLIKKPVPIYTPPAFNLNKLPLSPDHIVGNNQNTVTIPTTYAYA